MGNELQMCTVFTLLLELAKAKGVERLDKLDNLWEYEFDGYGLSMNGHANYRPSERFGINVPPHHCFIVRNETPLGLVDPFGGTFLSSDATLEDQVIEDLKKEVERVRI